MAATFQDLLVLGLLIVSAIFMAVGLLRGDAENLRPCSWKEPAPPGGEAFWRSSLQLPSGTLGSTPSLRPWVRRRREPLCTW